MMAAPASAGQRHQPRSGVHHHLPAAVPAPRAGVITAAGPLVTVPAQELRHFCLKRGPHQQLRPEPGDLLQDHRLRPVLREQLIDVEADSVSGRYSDRHARRPFPRRLWSASTEPTHVSFTPAPGRHPFRVRRRHVNFTRSLYWTPRPVKKAQCPHSGPSNLRGWSPLRWRVDRFVVAAQPPPAVAGLSTSLLGGYQSHAHWPTRRRQFRLPYLGCHVPTGQVPPLLRVRGHAVSCPNVTVVIG